MVDKEKLFKSLWKLLEEYKEDSSQSIKEVQGRLNLMMGLGNLNTKEILEYANILIRREEILSDNLSKLLDTIKITNKLKESLDGN